MSVDNVERERDKKNVHLRSLAMCLRQFLVEHSMQQCHGLILHSCIQKLQLMQLLLLLDELRVLSLLFHLSLQLVHFGTQLLAQVDFVSDALLQRLLSLHLGAKRSLLHWIE